MSDDGETNGYRNYNTWCVALCCDNEQSSYEHWRERAKYWRKNARRLDEVTKGCWTAEETARFRLADELQAAISDANPLQEASLFADLLSSALGDVDWQQVADNWLDEFSREVS
jgi:hypothetical protein